MHRPSGTPAPLSPPPKVTGKPYLLRLSPYGGLPGPRNKVPGGALAGRVRAVGAKVTGLRAGDEVFGQAMAGAFAQYVVVSAAALVLKPDNLSMAATAPQGLREAGQVTVGQRVLTRHSSRPRSRRTCCSSMSWWRPVRPGPSSSVRGR